MVTPLQRNSVAGKSAPLRLLWDIAAVRFEFALLKAGLYGLQTRYRPDQPRVPAGESGGGQWTNDDVHLASRRPRPAFVPVRAYGRSYQATPEQASRFAAADARARQSMDRVAERDPSWRSPASAASDTLEGSIRLREAEARAAEARLAQLDRLAIGGNNPPAGETITPREPPTPREVMSAYRDVTGMPRIGDRPAFASREGTVAYADIDGRPVIGVNSNSPGYTETDFRRGQEVRSGLIEKYPGIMNTDNPGRMPNDAVFHAEETLLIRAADHNGGTLAGRHIEMHVDRRVCVRCEVVLPALAYELGNPTIRVTDGVGRIAIITNGTWSQIQ